MKSDFNILAVMEFLNCLKGRDEISFSKTASAMKADICTTPKILEMLLRPNYHNVPIWTQGRIIRTYINEKLKHYKTDYDFVITQQKSALPAIRFARRIGAKSILFLRYFSRLLSQAAVLADIVIANSEFIRKKCDPFRGDIKVLYLPINLNRFNSTSKKTNKYVSMVSPTPSKGGQIFADLARKMLDRKFLAVGRKLMQIHFPSNVKYVRWIDDMRDFYSQSSVVLIPSIWDEPFSKIAPEAQASGVPVISTKMGGLPESNAGQLFVDNPYNLEEWTEKIGEAEDNRKKYVEAGLKNASGFDERKYYRKLKDIMKEYENC